MNCSAKRGKGIAWQGDGQQRKGVDKLSTATAMRRMGMKRDAEEKQRMSIAPMSRGNGREMKCIAEQGEGRAKNGEDLRRKAKA